MPIISFLMPYRKSDESREKAFEWSVRKWQHDLPEAEIIVASDDGQDPFSKTVAVNNAYRDATTDIFAIVDADIWVDRNTILESVKLIQENPMLFVQPCKNVARITKEKTEDIYNINVTQPFPTLKQHDILRTSKVVGLICMFSRQVFEHVGGMDPRFRGWGGEDNAWNQVMHHVCGQTHVGEGTAYHLWHNRARNDEGRPIWPGQSKRNGKLGKRYDEGAVNRVAMTKLLQEVKDLTNIGVCNDFNS